METSECLEEDEEKEIGYFEEETTTEAELADFEKHVKEKAKQAISKYNEGQETMSEDKFLDSVNLLNDQQRKIFDDFVEIMMIYSTHISVVRQAQGRAFSLNK